MPRANFLEDFRNLVRKLGLPNRGFGALYVDNQCCNLESYQTVTGALMDRYGVSRKATTIRLEALGLLQDARRAQSPHPIAFLHSTLEGIDRAQSDVAAAAHWKRAPKGPFRSRCRNRD